MEVTASCCPSYGQMTESQELLTQLVKSEFWWKAYDMIDTDGT